ncbi:MAG: ParB N-terminal domain-containing protein [Candidatus Zixiibacteriota bacterium]
MKEPKSLSVIEVSSIEPNPENPRGINILEDDPDLSQLEKSIRKYGLLVPLIVMKKPKPKGRIKFVLLDGERRYWALKRAGVNEAPAHVLPHESSLAEAKNLMFHIHTNRVQWGAVQQCHAVEEAYEDLNRELGGDYKAIAKRLAELTGTHIRTMNDRLLFLKWPKDIKKHVYDGNQDFYWTIVEIEKGIIQPASKNFPDYFDKVSSDAVREFLFEKYQEGVVHAGTDARKMKAIVNTTDDDPRQYKFARQVLEKLVKEKTYSFDDARDEFLARFPEAEKSPRHTRKSLINRMLRTSVALGDYDFSLFESTTAAEKKEFIAAFSQLLEVLQRLERELRPLLEK